MPVTINGTSGITGNSGTLISASTIGVGNATPAASGAGVTFPATQSASTDANTLDDYEEGTWTAGYTAGTLGTQNCSYIKVGRMVTVLFQLQFTASGTSLGAITGLPFNMAIQNYVATHSREWFNTGQTTQCVGSIGSATLDLFFYNNTRAVVNGSTYGVSGFITYQV